MKPNFWKLSQGATQFNLDAILDSIKLGYVYVHQDTHAKATSSKSQGENFIDAPIGDYFYLTHGNAGIYALGQFSGPANLFSIHGDGWLDRPFRHIRSSLSIAPYEGPRKWWAPNENSTFTAVPDVEVPMFEEHILKPYFGIALADFGLNGTSHK
jgi:hypothetical protein